uniref:Selenoprotein P n=1 Tax=Sphenodon punctatus TaxID=8508 RepID=A0A8D0HQN8_SPHPU
MKYHLLREKVSQHIPVYQQDEKQPDVWTTLNGRKDDFFIYDRCGRLVYHLGLPYSFLTFPHVEEAIQIAYCEHKCGNCSYTIQDVENICNATKRQTESTSIIEVHPHNHHAHHHNRQRHQGHKHHPQEGDQPQEDQKHPASAQAQRPHSPQSNRRHHNRGRNKQTENLDLSPQREVVEAPVQARKP